MITHAVNLRHSPFDVYIGRARKGHDGYFGNPYPLRGEASRGQVLDCYRAWFVNRVVSDPEFRRRVLELRGKRLGCFCKPKDCHGDVIAAWVNAQSVVRP